MRRKLRGVKNGGKGRMRMERSVSAGQEIAGEGLGLQLLRMVRWKTK